jgi:hypothetical protein
VVRSASFLRVQWEGRATTDHGIATIDGATVCKTVRRLMFGSMPYVWFDALCLVRYPMFGSMAYVWFDIRCLVRCPMFGSIPDVWFDTFDRYVNVCKTVRSDLKIDSYGR